jgi:hypothetical protein
MDAKSLLTTLSFCAETRKLGKKSVVTYTTGEVSDRGEGPEALKSV